MWFAVNVLSKADVFNTVKICSSNTVQRMTFPARKQYPKHNP